MSAELTQAQAQAVKARAALARQVLAKRKLMSFVEYNDPSYKAGWVHKDICERLERFMKAVEEKKGPRLILAVPPRHGKSRLASQEFIAWAMGHHPDWEFINAGYNADLPMDFSRKVRARVATKRYQNLFPDVAVSADKQSAAHWMTDKGGGYLATGVGGGATGKGAHIFVIDDPVKNAEEADSDTVRSSVWDWYGTTAKTRLAPGGGMLIIMTRWHYGDLAGLALDQDAELKKELTEVAQTLNAAMQREKDPEEREFAEVQLRQALAEYDALDHWELVIYPAVAEQDEYRHIDTREIVRTTGPAPADCELLRRKGEALHPDRYPLPRLLNMKRTMQPRHWTALYQQSPTPDEGGYFQSAYFRFERFTPPLDTMKVVVAWDLAVGEKKANDYTAGWVMGLDYQGFCHVLQVVRGRWSDMETVADMIIDTHVRWKAQITGVEHGQLALALGPSLRRRLRERKAKGEKIQFVLADGDNALKPITDKDVRARPLQGLMQQGLVFFPPEVDAPWVTDLKTEFLRFPAGLHDDIVDAGAWAARMMIDMKPPERPREQDYAAKKGQSWRDRIGVVERSGGGFMSA